MKKKTLMLVAIAASCLGAGTSTFAQQTGDERLELVAAATVSEAGSIETKRYPGRVVSPSIIAVTSRVSGDLLEVGFREGDFVKKGQLLYRLDDIRYVAAKKSAEAKIAEYRARVAYSKANLERTQQLFERDVSTQDELESARSEYEANEATLDAARADLIVAEDDLKNTKIVAMSDGRIGVNAVPVGSYVSSASGTLTTIVQFDPVRVRFSMSNRDFLAMFGDEKTLREQATVSLLLADGKEYTSKGTIDFIDNSANAQTDTIQIYALFENADYKLLPGSTVTLILAKNTAKILPAVVPSAVMHDDAGAYVYVLDENNTVSRRDIMLGQTTNSLLFIESGLSAGEKIIVDGTHKAIPGRRVRTVIVE